MSTFALHSRLAEDCHRLGDLSLSIALLHRNAVVPWFILVPRVTVIELCDLSPVERSGLDREVDAVCRLVREHFPEVTKLNVAAIGNLVPQLHVHVVGRHAADACWPRPVWGNLQVERPWTQAKRLALVQAIARL